MRPVSLGFPPPPRHPRERRGPVPPLCPRPGPSEAGAEVGQMRELSSDPGYSSERPPAGRRCTQVASVHSFLNSSGLYLTCSTSGAGAFVHDLNIHEAFFFFFF